MIRLILACSVVLEHCPSIFGIKMFPGIMAVEMFFMISGFYMSMVLTDKYDSSTFRGKVDFYASRYWRLWPTFIITTIAVRLWWLASYAYLGHVPISGAGFRNLINNDIIFYAIKFSNLFMIGQDIPSIFHVSQIHGIQLTFGPPVSSGGTFWMGFMRDIGQAWSIGTEIWFYILAPFLCRLKTRWLLAIVVASFALRLGMDVNGLEAYFFFPAQISLFVVGMTAQRHFAPFEKLEKLIAIGGISMIATASLTFWSIFEINQFYKWVLYAAFAITMPSIFTYTVKVGVDRIIGELSYPIYIIHMFVLSVISVIGKRVGMTIGGEILLVVTIFASLLLYLIVDKPIGRWRARFAHSRTQFAAENALQAGDAVA